MDIKQLIYIVPATGVVALLFAFMKAKWVAAQDQGDETMKAIAASIADSLSKFTQHEKVSF